jgi:hypothetical protein
VTDEHGILSPVVQRRPDRGGIIVESGQGKINGEDVMAAINQSRFGATPAPRTVGHAVDQQPG